MKTLRDIRLQIKRGSLLGFLQTPLGAITIMLIAVALGVVTIKGGIVTGLLLLVLMIGIPVVYGMVAYPLFGISCIISTAFLLFFILRLGVDFPMGTILDGMQALLILGFFIKQKNNPDWSMFKGPVATMIFIWIGYNLLEVINPWAESRLAWVYTVRTIAVITLMYFVFVYQINTIKAVRFVLTLWLALACIAMLHAYKQEYIGIAPAELAGMESDPLSVSLLYIDGHWRKYAIFSDPVEFSYNMVITAVLCIALISGPLLRWKKIVLVCFTVLMLNAMLFSGTRGAYVLVPATLILFAVLHFSRQIMIFSGIAAFIIAVMIYMPTGNASLVRFQSAFRPSEDASYNVRKQNQKRIQPYIISHPMGGGLGATGMWGVRFAPYSFLANFPPDSGYMRVAVETGWIGLFIFCWLMFIVLKSGIEKFYQIRNPELRMYCLAMTLVLFALNIGNFPQEALVQYPNNLLFYLAIAIIQISYNLDKKAQRAEIISS
ncbi:O-antigen ligase family protein [Dyadobacter subterraneus]|uniref:O-antigen ligase family protein n=1 Tax=Dyadobacter subterraneus TaxID=2773304 RepID=A0ABR9WCD8_9BACT|nr:O-antigen ligase family protein [Dyadobacter subterraneus]MBE9463132.1 O-antigen ligase family protein [Dyadobacter subterraneus]